ncbi:MAG TPA: 3-deoxy-D-manno-octulosonic acid transferase [Pyrinomonadaceae bacterium]|nr:3-deoxy-D-manno-octulosonic acid transferase [Chloracidobacterium sp.]MBP9935120.1 3-deoxy-D-manno-octulosonic acid transferase [Pyrinomonadaceae bacterium]MBK7803453.1 3-deoxy-D-manno-octulosonic acid transferase [Chloracidobacterium sp.]MBK9766760.1 3-deoxy-D-manno-octulosonic acid transferase [Chloracidobacterium sp.]MBL0241229.1 3-deoxy-D-manno-octulosonic acid transferase [Chloracidobacterium sp.]
MFFLYSIILTIAFVVLLPRFIFDAIFNGKYASGLTQRLGFLPAFIQDGRPVIWVHCVSVGETNAARPLIQRLKSDLAPFRLIVSTTTRTGQQLARQVFAEHAEVIFYFPFDWKFSVRRALRRFAPSSVLLLETELWFNFLREANKSGAKVAIVNGRLSERSYKRFGYLKNFMRRVLSYPDLALMQSNLDAKRLMALGMRATKLKVTGNMKFDQTVDDDGVLATEFRTRFGISGDVPLIVAASTHDPEEKWLLEAFKRVWKSAAGTLPRLLIAPRHPERFRSVVDLIKGSGFGWARRSETASSRDLNAEVIILDSIGELRSALSLADIVFVGGSLIPHGGQSILEPAAAGKAIITGPHTSNFKVVVDEFLKQDALIQLSPSADSEIVDQLAAAISQLLDDPERRRVFADNAAKVMATNRGATQKTVEYLRELIDDQGGK